MSRLRSLLFVPADRPERFAKALSSAADGIILDLEDSVAPEKKSFAHDAVREFLSDTHEKPVTVRITPLDGDFVSDDLNVLAHCKMDGLVLPKAEGAQSVLELKSRFEGDLPLVLPIATETPQAIFQLGTYKEVSELLFGLTWGAEDLPAAIGAATSRETDGRYTEPYEMARSLTLFGAHAAETSAIETVYPNIKDEAGLKTYAECGRRDGFTAMMAIHPAQCAIINQAFMPSETEINWARMVVEAFASSPGSGVLKIDGKMLDAPHLKQANRILSLLDC